MFRTAIGPRSRGVAALMALLLLPLFFAGCGRRGGKEETKVSVVRPVKILTVRDAHKVLVQGFPGIVRAARRAVLSFKVSGRLIRLPVEEGQEVVKGQLIAQLDQRDFLNAVKEAKARYRQAEEQFQRYKELYAKGQVSRADFDMALAARDVAKAKLDDARNRLADTRLLAPFAGLISKRYVENYYEVKANEPIVNLQDISRIEVVVDLPELVMAAVREKNTKRIVARFPSIPGKEFPLEIKEYATEADPATQTYQVVFVMDRPADANILPGMTATVTATYTNRESGPETIVPALAVLDAPKDRPYVWVYDPSSQTVRRRFVKVGRLEDSGSIRILQGLRPGEIIVVAGVTKLKEGMKVRPWEGQREGS